MNTINTVEDLIQVLDENPEWLEALRTRLLTRELIELPDKFASFVAETNNFVAEMNSFVAEMRSFVAEMRSFVAETNRRLDSLETGMNSIRDDVGILKGAHARSAALREASAIAREMGLRRVKSLTQDDLWDLIDVADTADIHTDDLKSFRRADLIMEAADREGATCYIAVEISFTVNGRDTTRALRNAALLTQFTGKTARPAVAGLRRDDRIQGSIESGELFWYQLDPEILEAE